MELNDLFSSKSCLCLNKKLIKIFGLNETCFLTALIDKRIELGINEFYILQEEIATDYGIPRQTQSDIISMFVRKGIITAERRGIPSKNWYTINDEKLIELYEGENLVITTDVEIPTTSCQTDLLVPTTDVEIPTTIIYNLFNIDILVGREDDIKDLYKGVSEKKLEKYKDYLEGFTIYWLEKDKKGIPRWKKQTTWSLLGRLALWKRNNDTNFGKNKPVFPLEEIKQVAVSYWTYKDRKPELAKEYANILKKYNLLENGKWKEYAKMVVGAGFNF